MNLSPVCSNYFSPFTTIRSIIRIFVHNLYSESPLYLAASASKVTHYSHNLRHPFSKHVHAVAVYFFVSLLLCFLCLTNAFIQWKIA